MLFTNFVFLEVSVIQDFFLVNAAFFAFGSGCFNVPCKLNSLLPGSKKFRAKVLPSDSD